MLALETKKWMEKTAKSQKIKTDEGMETIIDEVMKLNDKLNKQHFRGKEDFCWIKITCQIASLFQWRTWAVLTLKKIQASSRWLMYYIRWGAMEKSSCRWLKAFSWKCRFHLKADYWITSWPLLLPTCTWMNNGPGNWRFLFAQKRPWRKKQIVWNWLQTTSSWKE